MSLEEARVLLDADRRTWRAAIRHRLAELERRMAALRQVKEGLEQALTCPAEHHPTECPYLEEMLDARIGSPATGRESGE